MTAALRVFVFQCEGTECHALTLYRAAHNLPAGSCTGRWVFRAQLLMTPQSLATIPIDSNAAMADLRQHGYHLTRIPSKIILFPR
jgi:hypothetical protein